jgi:hypothetical protein
MKKEMESVPEPVEPVVAKPKRQLTQAQIEALKKGRARLAEKRVTTAEPSEISYQLCAIM